MAICMDINNGTDFTSPWDAYELATFVQKSEFLLSFFRPSFVRVSNLTSVPFPSHFRFIDSVDVLVLSASEFNFWRRHL